MPTKCHPTLQSKLLCTYHKYYLRPRIEKPKCTHKRKKLIHCSKLHLQVTQLTKTKDTNTYHNYYITGCALWTINEVDGAYFIQLTGTTARAIGTSEHCQRHELRGYTHLQS